MEDLQTLLLQIVVILITAQLLAYLFARIHQPRVMGEMLAGILLGPSLLGWLAPDFVSAVFPEESLSTLKNISQLGVLLFLFVIGLELNVKTLRKTGYITLACSQASIFVPFVMACLLAVYLYPVFGNGDVGLITFSLFFGTAISITAFPVLARIMSERKILRTNIGTIAIGSAAINDAVGWCLLAVILIFSQASRGQLWLTLLLPILYISFMVLIAKPISSRLEKRFQEDGRLTDTVFALILFLLFTSCWLTERAGIHALFGAFFAGAIMPKSVDFINAIRQRLEGVTLVLLMPLYFAFTGLKTSVRIMEGIEMWIYFALIFSVAVAGKIGGVAFVAKKAGMQWREATTLGVLMNSRGLMELIVLNIGLDLGIISPDLFSIMVFMALTTTLMTAPLLQWIYINRLSPAEQELHRAESVKA